MNMNFACLMYCILLITSYLIMFNVMTWNVTGIFSSSSYLSDVLTEKHVDICGLSEHWLYPHNLHFLNALNMNYNVYAKCDKDLCVTNAKGAGKGGVALLWHKKLDHLMSPLPIDDDRLIGLQLQLSPSQYMYFIQVYFFYLARTIQA